MRPDPSAYPPREDLANRPREESQIWPPGPRRCAADCVLAVNRPDRRPKQVIGLLRLACELLRDDPDKRDCRTDRVTKWCPAAARVPSIKALWRETQPDNAFLTMNKREGCWRDLDNVGAAMGIEEVGAAKVVKEGLAIVAVTHDAVHCVRRDVCDHTANLSTTTLQRRVLGHSCSRV